MSAGPLHATCHCGKVRLTIPHAPAAVTNCNCSICRRYGVLWGYYTVDQVAVDAEASDLADYVWGDRMLKFVRCAHCGVVVAWMPLPHDPVGRCAINIRNFDPAQIGDVRIRRFDGADTWRFLED